MRILFVAASHPESAWLYKALQESAHSLQRAEDVRDGAFLPLRSRSTRLS